VEAKPREILFLKAGGFSEWMDALEQTDSDAYDAVVRRLERVEDGNFGNCGSAGGGVCELRFIKTGPGYRVYYGEHDDLVIILGAGIKKTQDADIKLAKKLWKEYDDE
jgi:putative addiction module killer protein